jgi:excisionase family DNA binding protein
MVVFYYTVDQIADKLNLNQETIRRKLRKGDIIGQRYGREWRITERNLRDTLKLWGSHINQINNKLKLDDKNPRVLRKLKGQKQKLIDRLEGNCEIKM